jgi:hypothetical protein
MKSPVPARRDRRRRGNAVLRFAPRVPTPDAVFSGENPEKMRRTLAHVGAWGATQIRLRNSTTHTHPGGAAPRFAAEYRSRLENFAIAPLPLKDRGRLLATVEKQRSA